MKIYLDCCCFGRPYDDQSQDRIFNETKAKLAIQKHIATGNAELVSSEYLIMENGLRKDPIEKETIEEFMYRYSCDIVESQFIPELLTMAETIAKTGIKPMDSKHVASAIVSHCDCFITVDDRILKYKTNKIKIMNPIDFARGEKIEF